MLILSGVSAVILSGCGGGSSDSGIVSVDILELDRGYIVTGFNDNSDIVEIEFCGNVYDEYVNYTHLINGIFEVNDVFVDFDYIGDNQYDYYIDTTPTEYNLVVGEIYNIYDDFDELIDTLDITNIELIECQ